MSSPPQFQEVSDLVARFESLVNTKATLKLTEQKRLVEMEATRAQLLSLQSEKQDEMLTLNQKRTQLVEQLEAAREHRQQWVRVPGEPTHSASRAEMGWGLRQILLHWAPETVLVLPLRRTPGCTCWADIGPPRP